MTKPHSNESVRQAPERTKRGDEQPVKDIAKTLQANPRLPRDEALRVAREIVSASREQTC